MKRTYFTENRAPGTQQPRESGWAAWRRACDTAPPEPPFKRPAPVEPQRPARTPVVKAVRVITRSGRSLLRVTCPFCGELHCHGTVGPNISDGDGPRYSHCVDVPRGTYILQEIRAKRRSAGNAETKR